MMHDLDDRVAHAVAQFWNVRAAQDRRQGQTSGNRDAGNRSAVTGGKQLDGFVELISAVLVEAGVPDHTIRRQCRTSLPGYFRATKSWDLLVVNNGHLLAVVEFKSQVGSFGNNLNNRSEEAIGSAADLWTAYREGAFRDSPRPWLGYFMLVEDCDKSSQPVRATPDHFEVFPDFIDASYQKRYELLCRRLVRERLYDAACLLVSSRNQGPDGAFRAPAGDLSFQRFAAGIAAYVRAHSGV